MNIGGGKGFAQLNRGIRRAKTEHSDTTAKRHF